MSTGDLAYVYGAMLATVAFPTLFTLPSLWGAGPRYRAALLWQLGIGWSAAALLVGWLTIGWFALESGGRWFAIYRDVTLVLMGASVPLLFIGIRAGNRTAAAAQAADRGLSA